MYDRQVRRRRAVLAALVALSLILLTAYFGESAGGALHSVQRGALQVLGPVQEGASRALKPFRDLFGWIGDTVDAKQERDELKAERDKLEKQVAELEQLEVENRHLQGLLEINTAGGLDAYEPVKARVTARSPQFFYATVTIDRGSNSGVKVNDVVVNGQGLVGRVTVVTPGYSKVTLLTDEEFAVAGNALTRNRDQRRIVPGIVEAELGGGGELRFELAETPLDVREGDRVVTAGALDTELGSYYPRGISIGRISRVDLGDGALDRTIHVEPAADLSELLWVEVLTKPPADAQTTASAAPTP